MTRYLVRRLIQSLFILVAISLISFSLIKLAPGGPEDFIIGPGSNLENYDEVVKTIRAQYGLDEPFWVQYGKWAWNMLRLDFGRSIISQRPVIDEVMSRLPNTLWLVSFGIILGFLGIPLGIAMAKKRGKTLDNVARVVTVVGQAVPHWWLGLIIMLGSVSLSQLIGFKIIPLPGYSAENDNFLYRLWQLALPSVLIAFSGWIGYSRFMRAQVLEVITADYVRTARAKGLPEKEVTRNHVLRNTLIPLVTAFGGLLPGLFGGSVIFERVFALPGMGNYALQAIGTKDYPVVMGVVIIASVLTMIGVLVSDILYGFIDPRIRYS